jgi:hypothetical protein
MRTLDELNCILTPEDDDDSNHVGWDDDLCKIPVLCIFEKQIPTNGWQDVIIHNFLPGRVIGYVVTEKCNVINPVVECEPDDDDTPAMDAYLSAYQDEHGDDDEDFWPEDDPICDDAHDDDDVEACENCLHVKVSLGLPPCDGCFGCEKWEPQAANVKEAPTPCADQAESLYRTGCWTTLENRLHDLMSEWSLLADKCQFKSVSCGCTHRDRQFCNCVFGKCPRVKS